MPLRGTPAIARVPPTRSVEVSQAPGVSEGELTTVAAEPNRRDVDGVFALAQRAQQVEARMAEALAAHLAHLRTSGRPHPDPHTDDGRIAA